MQNKHIKIDEYQLTEQNPMSIAPPSNSLTIRAATVTFKDDKFAFCQFDGVDRPYNYQDWVFIHRVADFIIKRQENAQAKEE